MTLQQKYDDLAEKYTGLADKYALFLDEYNAMKDKFDIMRQTYLDAVREIRHDLENMDKVVKHHLT